MNTEEGSTVSFDDVPFSLEEVRTLDCQYGQPYHKKKEKQSKGMRLQGSRKIGCQAKIRVKCYRIAGIFRGWKLLRISRFRGNSRKFYPRKFSLRTAASLSMGVSSSFPTIRESFNRENPTFSNSQVFLPTKDSRHMVYHISWLCTSWHNEHD